MTDTYWYEAKDKHYFFQAEEGDDGLFIREVAPLAGGGFRVYSWKQVAEEMEAAFHEDHRERDHPSDWDDAYKEHA